MKKLFVFILMLTLAFSLVACKEPSDIRGEYEGGNPTTAPTTAPTAPTQSFDTGRVNANKYTNKFAGISVELGADWIFMTDEQIRQNNEQALGMMGDAYEEALKNATTFTDMMATKSNGTDTVNITFEKLTGTNLLMTEEQYANISKNSLKGALESMGMAEVTLTSGTAPFAGKGHTYIAVSAKYSGIPVYERLTVVKCGNYMVVVAACTWQTDTCKEILDTFQAA